MAPIDLVCVALYFAAVAWIAWWASERGGGGADDYFLAGRGAGWPAIGASLFASNISAEHFIGLSGSGAASGHAVGQFEILACFILLLLGWLFVPYYLRTGVFTMPEFLELRFNRHCRTYLSAVSLIAYIFTKVSVAVYAGALVLNVVLGWNIWAGSILLIVATGLYTVTGGLRAVIYTDFLQAFILIGGAVILTTIALLQPAVGGFSGLYRQLPPGFFNLWLPASHPDFPWTGILLGAPILGVWYWCTDQMIVQRTLAAPSISEARRATMLAGFLKILPLFILVLPGLAGRILFPKLAPNEIYAAMVNDLLPPGVKGLVVAALLAALMSSLSSVFNSSSTLFVMDFYRRWRPQADDGELVRAGRCATGVLVLIGLLWLPFIGIMSGQIFVYLQSVQAYIAPPIAAVFLLGILHRGVTGKAALSTLLFGFGAGASRFVIELLVKSDWAQAPALRWFAGVNFLHFAAGLFGVSVLLCLALSIGGDESSSGYLRLSAKDGGAPLEEAEGPRRTDIRLSLALASAVIAIWIVFSPLVLG